MSKQVKTQFPSGQDYDKSFNPIIDEDANEARLLNNMAVRPTSAPARLQSRRRNRGRRGRGSRRGREVAEVGKSQGSRKSQRQGSRSKVIFQRVTFYIYKLFRWIYKIIISQR